MTAFATLTAMTALLAVPTFAATDTASATDERLETLKGQVETLNESFLTTKTTVDKLAKIKVSGYIQAQWQHADSSGIKNVAGGDFPTYSNQRLQLRRARLKAVYDNVTSQYVLEIEALPSGASLKDAEIILNEPWLKTFSLSVGLMDRPFGFEIPYSSSAHEAPERTRLYQTVFPGEKDLGVKIEANPTERMGFLQYFNLKAGVYTGTAGGSNPSNSVTLAQSAVKDTSGKLVNLATGKTNPSATGDEIDSTLDFIGRVGTRLPFYDLNLAIDAGASAYLGKAQSLNDSVFSVAGDTAMIATTGHKQKFLDRKAFGVDAQVYYTAPVIGDYLGGSSLRGEYVWGTMPGTSGSAKPYGTSGSDTPVNYMYLRNFSGWYLSWIQNYGNKLQSVVKYDVFDPNTDVKGSRVGSTTGGKLNATDLRYSTLGLGAIYYWDENVRITAYYDRVTNEKAGGTGNSVNKAFGDDLKDNVFTARVQVKF